MSSDVDLLWDYLKSGKPFFIAEAGVNHLGSLELGERLIREASEAGAHAIKFQSYKASELTTKNAPRFWDWEGEVEEEGSQFDSYSHLDSFGEAEHQELKRLCDRYKIEFMSTPFDNSATDYLERCGIRAYKIASCDLTNHPLLSHVGSKGKIVMLSTGAASLDEIGAAVNVLTEAGTDKILIMHCNLKYPTDPDQINLAMIHSINEKYGAKCHLGLSDHTREVETPAFALMLGANVVEKHYTVDKTLGKSADHWFSVDPGEVKRIVELMDLAYTMKGSQALKQSTESEERARQLARRSIVTLRPIKAGDALTSENIGCKRPGTGISPIHFNKVLGMKAARDLDDDSVLNEGDILDFEIED